MNDEEIKPLCRDLSPPDKERAILFNKTARDEERISYKMFLEKKILPRKIFIQGYQAMYHAAALFLAKNYGIMIDEHISGTHRNMREVLNYYTRDSPHHEKLMSLYEKAADKFSSLRQQYQSGSHFADRAVQDLMNEGFHRGKKVTYYNDGGREDPLRLTILEAEAFIRTVVEPFLFIMEKLTE
jgi:hypothetical protein